MLEIAGQSVTELADTESRLWATYHAIEVDVEEDFVDVYKCLRLLHYVQVRRAELRRMGGN